MSELQKNFVHWRKIFIQINIGIALLTTTVEIIMSFTLHFQNLILQATLMEYITEYFIQPNVIIWGSMFCLWLWFRYVNKNKEYFQSKNGPEYECGSLYDGLLNGALIVMLTISCGTVAYVHYIFRVTVTGFCIPIFLCIVFYSKKILTITVAISEIMLSIVAVHRYNRSLTLEADPYIVEDMAIIMVFVVAIGVIAWNIIKHMKAQYEQMVEAREAAEIANQAKSSFLASMSHEIRTPINAVMGMDEMILRRSSDEEILSFASDIKKASNSLLSIINDILDVSKIESGKMEILPVEYDLSSLIHDVYSSVAIKARDKGIDLILDVDEDLPNTLIGDDIRIRQILLNLLSNGVKYTTKGSVTLQIGGIPLEDTLLLSVKVKDTGIGIKKEDIPKLREKFQRIEEQRNRNIEGTGLGMNIAISLLELMGSCLAVESEYGVGSCFSFDVEQGIADPEPIGNLSMRFSVASQIKQNNEKMEWIAPKAKLLVVDDNAMNLKVFSQLLKAHMMRVDQVESGEACLEKAAQVQYDIIFLDDMMPGMDGMETLKRLKAMPESLCRNTPIIAQTANAVKGAMESYLEAGFDGYLAKPIAPDKLEKMVMDLLPPETVEYEEDGSVDGSLEIVQPEVVAVTSDSPAEVAPETPVFPEIFGINWQYGMSVWCNADLLMELATDFYHDLPGVKEKLAGWEAEIEDEEAMTNFCIRVHALKGSAATIGAMQLSALSLILEQASRAKDAEKIHQLWPYLKAMMEEYQENMQVLES